ncbi:HpcH/HpaI aldolase/citrate lyase family protein [Oceanobacillus polygoni]|uniref:Citrate lyase subunit beta/citryl-CoA lyase n=1 Tax=Oceanobacillus polygoni TaxID=1235259 RepID=A0A9X1CEL8_9BACI|nr:CoA ester lyase [Oceanobacillus polygoni]MBP2077170.1 citrate lyase subunit beta/citryl-CoA lyase [Oceanobacillus polygoni]
MYRSWLFVPGNQEKYLYKAKELSADVIIYDLEDAVPIERKKSSRIKVNKAINETRGQVSFVRVNAPATPYFIDDLNGIIGENLSGIVLPKVNQTDDIVIADYLLGQLERKHNLAKGTFSIIPLIETALGVYNVHEIAQASERILCLCFGAEDFMLDLNIEQNGQQPELTYARSKLVIASRLAGKEAPIDSVYTNFQDVKGLEEEAQVAKQSGFQGKLVIHPNQIEVVNEVFYPTTAQIEEAQKIVALYNRSLERGEGAIQFGGKMIDVPVAERARKILSYVEF